MPGIKERVDEVRERHPFVDHVLRMVEHYNAVKGNIQAGAVTYFGFLSFFPILALAFAVVGFVGRGVPDAEDALVDAISKVFPNMIGNGRGEIPLDDVKESAPAILSVGLPVVLYSGLGWLSAMREALLTVLEMPTYAKPNFIIGKLRDVITLAAVGLTLVLSVSISGVATSASAWILEQLRLDTALQPLLIALGVAVGLAANMVLFFAIFKLLANPDTPTKALWQGAMLGAVGFEVLKQLSTLLLKSTQSQPAFQAFGVALILVVWINYFSRVVMYAAAWAHTSAPARAAQLEKLGVHAALDAAQHDETRVARAVARGVPPGYERAADRHGRPVDPVARRAKKAFVAGSASMLALVAAVRRITKSKEE